MEPGLEKVILPKDDADLKNFFETLKHQQVTVITEKGKLVSGTIIGYHQEYNHGILVRHHNGKEDAEFYDAKASEIYVLKKKE